MSINRLSIIIPVFNEENTIFSILEKIRDVELIGGIKKEIIIVNDCSADNTEVEIIKFIAANTETDIQYFNHPVNKGKGAALHTGISKATRAAHGQTPHHRRNRRGAARSGYGYRLRPAGF